MVSSRPLAPSPLSMYTKRPRADLLAAYKDGKYIFPNDEVSGAKPSSNPQFFSLYEPNSLFSGNSRAMPPTMEESRPSP